MTIKVQFILIFVTFSQIILSCKKIDQSTTNNFLNIPLSSEISTLDPAISYDTVSATVVYQALEQLYEYHYLKRPYVLQPLLAESMPKIEENGTKYTIKIKKNVLYHNDDAFNGKKRYLKAQDFITQLKRLAFIPTRSNGWWLFENKIVGLDEFRNKAGEDITNINKLEVSGLQAPDDHTFIIKLKAPYPQLLNALAMSFTSPIPYELVEKYDNKLDRKLIGTGPFMLDEWLNINFLKLKKFDGHHGCTYPVQGDRLANDTNMLKDAGKSLPFISGINFHIIKEQQTQWLNFMKGKIDYLLIPKDNYSSIFDDNNNFNSELKKKNLHLQVSSSLTYWWISFNMTDPILGKNLNLRNAIAHAINIDKYIDVFTNNVGLKANSIFPPGIPGYNPNNELPYEYNLEKAKRLLAKAGYPEGKGLPELTYDIRNNNTTNRQKAEFIRSELAKIGVKIKVVANTFPAFLDKSRKGKLQFWQDGWALDYPDAENILQLLITKNHPPSPNSTYYSNPKFDQMYDELKLLENGPKKKAMMIEMEQIISKDMPWIMQYYARNYMIYHGHLKNYRHSDLVYNFAKYLRLEK